MDLGEKAPLYTSPLDDGVRMSYIFPYLRAWLFGYLDPRRLDSFNWKSVWLEEK